MENLVKEQAVLHQLIARQPVFDRDLNTIGYEILYRHDQCDHAEITNPTEATARVVLNSIVDIGLDALVGDKPAYINFDRDALEHLDTQMMPADKVVLEILENVTVDEALLARVAALGQRYTIALDDFVHTPETAPLAELAHIIKVDIRAHEIDDLAAQVETLRGYDAKLLAEKVETQEELDHCMMLGFDYFQGYFLCQPRIIRQQRIPSNRIATLNLLAKLNQIDDDVHEVQQAIEQDVALSYRLLRYINSAFFGLGRQIDSIQRAIIYLGPQHIRTWASVLALSGLDDKPNELVNIALIRGRMGSQIATALKQPQPDSFFMVGLLSVLDALLGSDMPTIIEQLPITQELADALIHRTGLMGEVLELCHAFELCNWQHIEAFHFDTDMLSDIYIEALAWADDASKAMTA